MGKSIIERMRTLAVQIKEADLAYYKHDSPIMTDREYDVLFDELQALEKNSGVVLSGSPTQNVSGEVLESLTPVRHTKPMLSAAKTKSLDDVIKFVGVHAVLVSWKLDGLTLVLRYKDGKLQQAITRGAEGRIGEDVTHTVRVFLNVPVEVPFKDAFEVRGEGVVSWSNFQRLNTEIEEPYTHPRNLAAGSVRKLNAAEAAKRYLEFVAFDMGTSDSRFTMKHQRLIFLADIGFDVVHHLPLGDMPSEAQIRAVIEWYDPAKCQYPVDGLIVEYDDISYGEGLGATGHHENRLLAYKWADELYETTFEGVELATTRTGMVSITGKFAPVEMDGAVITRAYLHNLDIFEGFRLGLGDKVQLYKANKIIPQLAAQRHLPPAGYLPLLRRSHCGVENSERHAVPVLRERGLPCQIGRQIRTFLRAHPHERRGFIRQNAGKVHRQRLDQELWRPV